MAETQTIPITNFGGRLTRIVNGELNSGFAKFATSWGYDPFSKPMNLTWLEAPSSIAGVANLMLATKNRSEAAQPFIYGIDSGGKAYKIQPNSITLPNLDSVIGIGSVTSGAETYKFGASMEFFGVPEKLYVGGDKQINSVPINSVVSGEFGGDAIVGSAANYVANVPRPMKQFIGKLSFGNGPTIGIIDSTNTVTSSVIGLSIGTSGNTQNIYSQINPAFPPEEVVKDLDVSPDFNYLFISASNIPGEEILTTAKDRQIANATDSMISKWNGTDAGITAATSMPSLSLSALQTYLESNISFANDTFGMSVNNGGQKLLNLPGNKAPLPNATGVNGNFVFWANPEIVGSNMVASLYYFGQLDQENPAGLYRLMRYSTTLASGFIYQVPLSTLVNNKYTTVNNAITALVANGYGKHYFSTMEINNTTTNYKFYRFLVTPTGTGTSQAGVYETQTQLFSKRVGISQIRVYTEPTVANNSFQVDIIGGDGNVVDNGTFTYTFAAGSDPNALTGALERINFNPSVKTLFAIGIRLTNLGSANMTIKKVEVDVSQEGK